MFDSSATTTCTDTPTRRLLVHAPVPPDSAASSPQERPAVDDPAEVLSLGGINLGARVGWGVLGGGQAGNMSVAGVPRRVQRWRGPSWGRLHRDANLGKHTLEANLEVGRIRCKYFLWLQPGTEHQVAALTGTTRPPVNPPSRPRRLCHGYPNPSQNPRCTQALKMVLRDFQMEIPRV